MSISRHGLLEGQVTKSESILQKDAVISSKMLKPIYQLHSLTSHSNIILTFKKIPTNAR